MMQTPNWKMKSEFHANLMQRWIDGLCPFWALNVQFNIIDTDKQHEHDEKEMEKD